MLLLNLRTVSFTASLKKRFSHIMYSSLLTCIEIQQKLKNTTDHTTFAYYVQFSIDMYRDTTENKNTTDHMTYDFVRTDQW